MDMYVEKRTVEDTSLTLTICIAQKELEPLERGAYLVVAQRNHIDVSGEGSAKEILEAKLSEPLATAMMVDAMKKFLAPFALSQEAEDYSVVGAPSFSEGRGFTEQGDMLFDATWVRLPHLSLSSYEPVEIVLPATQISEAEIDARMQEVAESYKSVEKDSSQTTVEEGSIVQISMECFKDNERYDQLCFSDRLYNAGSGQMPDGFDEALIGAQVGEDVHVDFILPVREAVDGTMEGPSLSVDVTVLAIMKEVTHALTDEFVAQSIPLANTIEELREQSRKEILQQKKEQMRHHQNFLAAEELAKRLEGTIADEAYDAVVNQLMDTLNEQALASRTTVNELLKSQGTTEEHYRLMSLMQARSQLRQGAALDAWARHYDLTIDNDDINEFFASSSQGKTEHMRAEAESGGYLYLAREGALRFKASEDLVSRSLVCEADALSVPV